MKMRLQERISKFIAISSVALSLILSLMSAQAQQTEGTGITGAGFVVDKIVAKVDNYIVLKSDLEGAYQNYLTSGNPSSEEAKCNILNSLVINKLMVAKADIDSVLVTDVEVDANTQQRMAVILQNSGNSPEQLEKIYGKLRWNFATRLKNNCWAVKCNQESPKTLR